MKYIIFVLIGFIFISCKKSEKETVACLIKEWAGKEILYPQNMHFVSLENDTNYLYKKEYKIVTYVDSIGCTACKLQFEQWKHFITLLDSINNSSVLFFICPKNRKEINYFLKKDNFTHPVCIDEKDSFNILNKFPDEMMFQTFLLDSLNKVLAIGNPIHSPKVKELYLKIIQGRKTTDNESNNVIQTKVKINKKSAFLGHFDWQEKQKTNFILKNTGGNFLVIDHVSTSCGCTSVFYSKEPILPDKELELEVTYRADHPEHFSKTITVYCNTELSPINLTISGNAE